MTRSRARWARRSDPALAKAEHVARLGPSGVDPSRMEAVLRSLIKGEFSSLILSFNDGPGPNYTTVQAMDEDGVGHGDWVSDAERSLAYASNSEWVLQWYPETPVGFCAIRASSLAAIFDAIATEAGTAATENTDAVHEGAGPQDIAQ